MEEIKDTDELIFENDEVEEIDESSITDLSKIISYNVANTVEVLKLKIDNDEIQLKPDFQRDFVWDIKRASLFIDSLLIGLPIPSIFLGKNKEDESYIVIDGQQRLKSVYFYISGKFVTNDKERIFSLKNLKDREWDGKTYAELDIKYKRRINNAVLNTTIIEDINYKPRVVHDIFHRLNTGGMPLTDQEIRNCVYSGGFNSVLLSLNTNEKWRLLLGKKHVDKRLRDVELILRFFALLNNLQNYKPSMREFLTSFQSDFKTRKIDDSIFIKTINIILDEIGERAFKTSSSINKSVCDSLMVGVAQVLLQNKEIIGLKESYLKLIKDEEYRKYITSSTSSPSHVTGRIDLARNYILGNK